MAAPTDLAKFLKPRCWCLAILIVICCNGYVSSKSKYVALELNAKWKSTPLQLEASEYIARESNDAFWSFVNAVSEAASGDSEVHDEEMYHLILKVADKLLTPLKLNLLKFSLSLRAYSPTVEMFNQMAYDKKPPENCEAFVDINNMVTCEVAAMKAFIKVAAQQNKPAIIKSDHHYPGSKDHPVSVILYGRLGNKEFTKFHTILREMAEKSEINYVIRHYISEPAEERVRLSGYGVELVIKNQEYKAKDDTKVEGEAKENVKDEDEEDEVQGFLFSELKKKHPDLQKDLDSFRQHLLETSSEMSPLKVWQLQDLSFQAAQRVVSSPKEEAMKVLRDINQNFPLQARSLVKTSVSSDLRKEIKKNQKLWEQKYHLGPGDSALFINGLQADLDIYDVFTLLDTLKGEAKLMEGLHALGIKGTQLTAMMKLDLKDSDSDYAVDVRDSTVVYLNDLEKDKRYQNWPSSVQDILRPTFPGMLRHVAKNFFHLVYFVDPSDPGQWDIVKMAEAFYVHHAPIRIGLVLVVDQDATDGMSDAGVALFRAFNYIRKNHTPVKALSFITDAYERASAEGELTSSIVINEFGHEYPQASTDEVFGADSQYDKNRKDNYNFLARTGLGESPQVLLNGVPMKGDEISVDSFEEAVVSQILRLTPQLQKDVYHGELADGMDILEHVMTRGNVMPRLNSRVLNPSENYVDFTHKESAATILENPDAFASLSTAEMSSVLWSAMNFMAKKDESSVRAVTNWVVCDLETESGRELLYEAVKQMKHTNDVRLGIVHNPTNIPSKGDKKAYYISRAIQVALETQEPGMAKSFVTKLLKQENIDALNSGEKKLVDLAVHNMDFEAYQETLNKANNAVFHSHRIFCERVLEFKPGERGIITNGKVIGPLKADELFTQEDFSLLEKYTMKTSAEKIKSKVKTMKLEDRQASDLIMRVSSLLNSVPMSETRKELEYFGDQRSVIKIPADDSKPAYDVVAILDPATRAAQKYTPLLMVLQEVANVNIKIFINSREKLSEMPLKSFYRYVLEAEVSFGVDSSLSAGPAAKFQEMPQKPLLTLGIEPPESWLVEAVDSPYDLDNIYLEEVESGVYADFELEYLLLEGHCYDSQTGQPPRGLQFILGTNSTPAYVDTIVMANLGYFQLKATPGAWILRLRPGRSSDLYHITSHEYTDSPSDSSEVITVVDSFKSKIVKIRVEKKKGKEGEDLLSGSDDQGGGIWDSISNEIAKQFGYETTDDEVGTISGDSNNGKDETLNIFSVASGHLYERFLRIMMLSVLKNTQSKVKFWFLKNYLSPSFKNFIPHMAEKYGFEYELVQYKWPRWLHAQTEKQRIIWGYKILFLDVLFPLDVQKIIFVDADQIVRADLQELYDLDLEGAPYGYTPFCDSRTEMDGFRFWKSGYWASHLAGRKYHISALYVVDLKKFRKVAAGDRLRGQYQGLSQDPNSLSNLDQDLPNNMIHQVAIKSLPQEWLWCETWCSDQEKKVAKTIDLCNNPQTKEAKLTAAKRIVPEWTDYDNEVKTLWDKFYKSNTSTDTKSNTDSKRDEL